MKSSYLLGSCPNLELWCHHRIIGRFSKHNATSKTMWKWRGNIHTWKYDATSTPFPCFLWRRVVFAKPLLKSHLRHYDVIWLYVENTQNTHMTLWCYTNLCCLCQNVKKYKWLLLEKGLQIQINNKTIIEFSSCRTWRIIKA